MRALQRPELRIRAIRRWAWVMAPAISIPVSYLMAALRAPHAPSWLGLLAGVVATPIAGVLMARALTSSVSDLLVARLGNAEERRRRLAEPTTRFTPATSRAALALEAGELSQVAALLDSVKAIDRRQSLFAIVTQRKALVTGDPKMQQLAVDELLKWRPRLRFGVHREIARYHAFVLASALATRGSDDPSVLAAARGLRADPDFEVRAYATWLETENDSADTDHLLAGAALARAAGREPLAQDLELRAARHGVGKQAPYRAG